MKKISLCSCLFLCLFLIISETDAQDTAHVKMNDTTIINEADSLKDLEKALDSLFNPKKSYFKVELNFLNNNVYFGRKDSVATPYITPSLAYYHKSGLYLDASASYLPTSGENRIDLFTIAAGYSHKFGNLETQFTASKFFYNSNSYNVESEIEGTIAAAFSYDWDIITPIIIGTAIFGQATDYATSFGLEHTFYIAKNHIDITLSAIANASTQNYYNSYYQLRKYKRLEKLLAKRGITENITAAVADAERFKLLDYELSLPINYSIKKFTFSLNPVYAIPVNPASITFTAKLPNQIITRKYEEKISSSFFFQAGIAYKF